ncbi:copper-binding protein [Pseudomonas sp. NPDC087598]|uniref:copper-binding protein n=1 Tax=Pseudomonas sp. NPDC087598 TaxID=3364440 RepID=UPI003813CF99
MKPSWIVVAGVVSVLSFAAWAEEMQGMKMEGMAPQLKPAPVANAEGTIKAIDPAGHTVTLAHGAVPALQWPPMTMGFSVTEEQLAGLAVGDRVWFSFRMEEGKATIVSMKK